MAFDISSIKDLTKLPPRVVIYGPQGVGKTTLAMQAESPILLPMERGISGVKAFPVPDEYLQVPEAMTSLHQDDHDFKTLVVDGIDILEMLIWEHVCSTVPNEKGDEVKRIENYGYNKGYTHALVEWRFLLRGFDRLINDRGMTVVLISHAAIQRFDSPDAESYDRYNLRLDKKAAGVVCDWADMIGFLNFKAPTVVQQAGRKVGRAAGTKQDRVLYTALSAARIAKNRYRMPETIVLGDDTKVNNWQEAIWKYAKPK